MSAHRVMPKSDVLPRALYRAEQVRELDRVAIEEYGMRGETLMERAGGSALAWLRELWPAARDITVLAGIGNNGGDAFVLARLARAAGFTVRVLQLGQRERLHGDAQLNAQRYADVGGEWREFERLPERTDVIVDGLFGTGLERAVTGPWAAAVDAVNAHGAPVLALDIPSGLHADSGRILGVAVRAAATMSFIGLKQGLFTADGPECSGRIAFDALEVPARIYAHEVVAARRLDAASLREGLPRRPRGAHKGHFGHVLVIGGDLGLGGAARLAAEAAARSGAGLTSLATRPEHVGAVLAARPEIMVQGVVTPPDADAALERATVIAVGPGLGKGAWGQGLFDRALRSGLPMVIDADALGWLAAAGERRENWVLTPHPGEAARLLGCDISQVQEDRFAAVEALQRRFGGVAVLKGAGSLVQSAQPRPPAVCCGGNPGMASGGMGDVLTGVIAGLMAQGHDAAEAAELGVCLHAAAADAAAVDGERGLLATDLMAPLHRLANPH